MTNEVRKNPFVLTERVIIARGRGRRPSDFHKVPDEKKLGPCFFCPGKEHLTPPEVLSYRHNGSEANHEGWWIRVVPNKFPALELTDSIKKKVNGLYESYSGMGIHEVVITKHHDYDWGHELFDHDFNLTRETLWGLFQRKEDLKSEFMNKSSPVFEDLDTGTREGPLLKYILSFKNHGASAGASLDHGHLQIIGYPFVPSRIKRELYAAEDHYRESNHCLYCDIIEQDLREGDRIVDQNKDFVVFEPFASRFPFETWILPKSHQPHYYLTGDNGSEGIATSLSKILSRTFLRLNVTLNNPDYNFYIHDSPLDFNDCGYYHWHIEIDPVLSRIGGWEKGTDDYINTMSPEVAADYLRKAIEF